MDKLLDTPLPLIFTLMSKANDRQRTGDETSHITERVDAARRQMRAYLEANYTIV